MNVRNDGYRSPDSLDCIVMSFMQAVLTFPGKYLNGEDKYISQNLVTSCFRS